MFGHLRVVFWQVSETANLHRSEYCLSRTHRYRQKTVSLHPADVRAARLCRCASGVPADLEAVLAPAVRLADLHAATEALTAQLAAGQTLSVLDVHTLRTGLAGYDGTLAELTGQLQTGGAPDAAPAYEWAEQVRGAAERVSARVDATLAPDAAIRAAAATTMPRSINELADRGRYRTLESGPHPVAPRIYRELTAPFEAAITSGADVAALRAQVLAVPADLEPDGLAQVPDVPAPAGLTLQEAIRFTWRQAAAREIGDLFDRWLQLHRDLLADTAPSVLVWAMSENGEPDDDAAALLAGCPSERVNDHWRAWLVPSIIGRAVDTLHSYLKILCAPLPPGQAHPVTDRDVHLLLTGPYTTALTALYDEMDADDVIAAAAGIAHTAT